MDLLSRHFAPMVHLSRHLTALCPVRVHDEIWQRGCYTLVHCREGVVHLERDGNTVTLPPDESGLAEPGTVIRLGQAASANWLTCSFVFTPDGERPKTTRSLDHRNPQPDWRRLTGLELAPRIEQSFQGETGEMIDRLAKRYCQGPLAQLEANLELGQWLLRYLQHLGADGTSGIPVDGFVAKVDALIRERLRDGLRVTELARLCGMSTAQLRKRYQEFTGVSPGEALERAQLQTAETLLARRDTPIAEVAIRAGFRNASAFSRWFRATTGLTPRDWRVRHRG